MVVAEELPLREALKLELGFELAKVCERGALPQRRVGELSAVTL